MQAPPGVHLPTTPALDVRNDAVLRRDVFVLGDLYTPGGTVWELSDERLKTQASRRALGCHQLLPLHQGGWAAARQMHAGIAQAQPAPATGSSNSEAFNYW